MSPNEPTRSHETRPEQTADHLPNQTADHLDADTQPVFAEELPPDSCTAIPGYEILGELGRGGMGVVFKARQLKLNRLVALKTMLRSDAIARSRFLAEAEAVAAVKHPNVVQVYESGEHAGQPYLAMEYLAGGTLADHMATVLASGRREPAVLSELLPVLARVASGVAAAHEAGIVHRDLKPINVLFDENGEPKVTDFGLAKRPTSDLTQTQTVMGTPHYMAPEQATGAKFAGPQADVWALGVILYECLTGTRPFDGTRIEEVLHKVVNTDPVRPRAINRATPRDVELICLKCLEKHPADRYPTAKELAADRQRLVNGEPITLRPTGLAERLTKWAKRKPTAAAAYGFSMLAVALALVVFVIFGFWREAEGARDQLAEEQKQTIAARDEAIRLRGIADAGRIEEARLRGIADAGQAEEKKLRGIADRAKDDALQQKALAEAAKKEADDARKRLAVIEYGRSTQVAQDECLGNNKAGARILLDRTQAEFRNWEWHYVSHLASSGHLVSLKPHSNTVFTTSWSPDESRVVTSSDDHTVRVWDAKTGAELLNLKAHTQGVSVAAWSPDSTRLVTATGFFVSGEGIVPKPGEVKVWDAKSGAELLNLRHVGPVSSASFSADGARIITGSWDKTARVWDAKTGAELLNLKHTGDVDAAAISPDGSRLLTRCVFGNTVKVWDGKSGIELLALKGHEGGVCVASWNPDGFRILTGGNDSTAKVWDGKSGAELLTLKGHTGEVYAASWNPDGSRITTGSRDKTTKVWDGKTGTELLTLKGHTGEVYAASWNRDGTRILTSSVDGTAKVWDATTGGELLSFNTKAGYGGPAVWSPSGSRILCCYDKTARVCDARIGANVLTLRHTHEVIRAAWNPDGTRIISFGDFGPQVWDAKTGDTLPRQFERMGKVWAVSWSPNGTRILTGGEDGAAMVWDAKTGVGQQTLKGKRDRGVVSAVAWSRDGSRILTGSSDRSAHVWDATSGVELLTLQHTGDVRAGSFSPDGTQLVTACGVYGAPGEVRVWDVKTGAELFCIKGHTSTVWGISYSPDSTRLLTGSSDRTAKVWDAKTGAKVLTLDTHTGDVYVTSWSPDGTRILTGSGDGTAKVWDAKTGAEVLTLKGHTRAVRAAAWSPDGSRILTGSSDKTVKIWDAGPSYRSSLPEPALPSQAP